MGRLKMKKNDFFDSQAAEDVADEPKRQRLKYVPKKEEETFEYIFPETAVDHHRNGEEVIRHYLWYVPPVYFGEDGNYKFNRDYIRTIHLTEETKAKSILDIGAGLSVPYKGNLRKRTKIYKSLDLRPGPKIDYVMDVTDMKDFEDHQWDWGWCTETIEHIPPALKDQAANEIMRVCKNCVFTYPTPKHETFAADPGHTEVLIDWKKKFEKTHEVVIIESSTGRVIVILKSK